MIEVAKGLVDKADSREEFARLCTKAGDVSLTSLLQSLEFTQVPVSRLRPNVSPVRVDSMSWKSIRPRLFGLYTRGPVVGVSIATSSHPFFARQLVAAIQSE